MMKNKKTAKKAARKAAARKAAQRVSKMNNSKRTVKKTASVGYTANSREELEKRTRRNLLIRILKLYDGQPRSKEELHRTVEQIVKHLKRGKPLTIYMVSQTIKVSSELKDADPLFAVLYHFKYPEELNKHPLELPEMFVHWAVEEGLAPAEEESQLATEYIDLAIYNALVSRCCDYCRILIPLDVINFLGRDYYLFDEYQSDKDNPTAIPADDLTAEQKTALQPDANGEVPVCVAVTNGKNIQELIISDMKVTSQVLPPSDIELAITAEPGNECWTVYSHETGDFYDFHAKTHQQAAQVRRARSGDTTFTAHGFAYNPNTGYYEADYLDGID